jgi:hypothetical protein
MAEGKKPPGWKSSQGPFWTRTGEQKCKQCLRISPTGSTGERAHARRCDEYPGETRIVLDEAEAEERRSSLSGRGVEHPIDRALAEVKAVEKQGKPEISDVYRRWCKQDRCCNCGEGPCDPHHEDTTIPKLKRGVGQKARDTLCVSLCRRCHDSLERPGGGYRLPWASGAGTHDHAESKAILHDAQDERLRRALDALPLDWRIEAMSRAVASVPEAVLKRALLGSETEDRLAEALDSAGEDLCSPSRT